MFEFSLCLLASMFSQLQCNSSHHPPHQVTRRWVTAPRAPFKDAYLPCRASPALESHLNSLRTSQSQPSLPYKKNLAFFMSRRKGAFPEQLATQGLRCSTLRGVRIPRKQTSFSSTVLLHCSDVTCPRPHNTVASRYGFLHQPC